MAALGNNTVEVIDLKTSAHVTSLKGFREPQGIASALDARIVAVANGQGEGLQFLDEHLRPARTVALGDDSDNVRYDSAAKRLYVGFGGGALAAVDPVTAGVIGRVNLPGHPESFQLEKSGTRIFVNVPTAGQIAVVDRAAMKTTASWPVTEATSNFPMALDEANHRLFVVTRNPGKLIVLDSNNGKVVTSVPAVGMVDDMSYDAQHKRLYLAGDQFVDVFEQKDADHYALLARVPGSFRAKTAILVPELNRYYLAVPHHGEQQAEVRVYDIQP